MTDEVDKQKEMENSQARKLQWSIKSNSRQESECKVWALEMRLGTGAKEATELNLGSSEAQTCTSNLGSCKLNEFVGVDTLFRTVDSFRANKIGSRRSKGKRGGGDEEGRASRAQGRPTETAQAEVGDPGCVPSRGPRHTHQKMVANFMLRQSSAKSSKRTLSNSWKRLSSVSQSVCRPGGVPTPSRIPEPVGRVPAPAGVPMLTPGWGIREPRRSYSAAPGASHHARALRDV